MPSTRASILALAVLAALSSACTADPCAPGTSAGDFCAYRASIVIEGGFICPVELPMRFDFGDVTLCGPEHFSRDDASQACLAAHFRCDPPLCSADPRVPSCQPGSDPCDVAARTGYVSQDAAMASCEGACTVCPDGTVGSGVTASWMVLPAASCACPPPALLGPLSCEDASNEVDHLFVALWSDPNTCGSDAECVSVDPTITCPDERDTFGGCPTAVHTDSQMAFEAVQAEVAARGCPRVTDCTAGPACAPAEAHCVAFGCRMVSPASCVDACASLGCGDCAARCLVAPDCVSAATDCMEVQGCDEGPAGALVFAQPYDDARGCTSPERVVGIVDGTVGAGTSDVSCGIGPDGLPYVFPSRSLQEALGWPDCAEPLASAALAAPAC